MVVSSRRFDRNRGRRAFGCGTAGRSGAAGSAAVYGYANLGGDVRDEAAASARDHDTVPTRGSNADGEPADDRAAAHGGAAARSQLHR